MSKKLKYISLQEASKLCSYSQDYLSLRARQGKVEARKIGRNWVTTKEWLDDYVKKVGVFHNRISGPSKSEARRRLPPQNLPVEETGVVLENESFSLSFMGAVVTVALAVFVFVGVVSGEQGVLHIYRNGVAIAEKVFIQTEALGAQAVLGVQDVPNELSEAFRGFADGIRYIVDSPVDFSDSYVRWTQKTGASVVESVDSAYAKTDWVISQGVRSGIFGIVDRYKKFNEGLDSLFCQDRYSLCERQTLFMPSLSS